MNHSVAADKLAKELSSILLSWSLDNPNGMSYCGLTNAYKSMMCKPRIPFSSHGFSSLNEFIVAFPEYFTLNCDTGRIKAMPREAIAAISDLIRQPRPNRRLVFKMV